MCGRGGGGGLASSLPLQNILNIWRSFLVSWSFPEERGGQQMLYLRVSASQQNMIQLGRSCDETTAYHFSALHLKVISNHPPSLFNTCSSSYRLFPHSCLTSRHFGAKFDIFHPSSAKRTLVMVVGRTGDGSSCWLHTSTLTGPNNRRQAEPGRAFYQSIVSKDFHRISKMNLIPLQKDGSNMTALRSASGLPPRRVGRALVSQL